MTLSALMKKGALRAIATAIPATAATDEVEKPGTVARIATVAVANPPSAETGAIDQIIDDQTVAVLIDSTVLRAPIWVALRDRWRPEEASSIPIFYASELPALRSKTAEQLRAIFDIRRTFGGGMVRQ